jgi:outer membrane receptor protein involved in Fe transport
MRLFRSALAGAIVLLALPAFPQTNPTGTITGKVVDQQGLALPGVNVTVQSPALQGTRSATTSTNGDYIIPFLPPGDYTIRFELSGFAVVSRKERVAPGGSLTVNPTMTISTLSETLTVVGEAADFGQSAQVATSYKKELVDSLPLGRNLNSAVLLAPGVQASGPNGNISVNGAMSFESLYLINGVVVNENLRGQAFDLFIEDALQETSISTAAISAEFGRFQGGVVSAVTKSGGNEFSGSYRVTFENDDWRSLTPYPNDSKTDDTIPTHEITLGGPIIKDKLWFFGAARLKNTARTDTTFATFVNFDIARDQKRYEGKLTWSMTPEHTFKGSYSKITDAEDGNFFGTIMDVNSLVNRTTPQDLISANYTGILSPRFFVEAQYSRRRFSFVDSGSLYTDLTRGTLLLDRSRNDARYWSPTFCGVCDDERRDNQNFIAKASYFLSTGRTGSHNIVVGFDMFDDKRFANNHQSGSDYRILGTGAILRGQDVFPIFEPRTTIIQWNPIPVSTEGNRFRTVSGFVNDAWTLNEHWSFNVGLRFDKNDGTDGAGSAVVKDSAFSPRFSATFDPKGNGQWSVNASFAQYVAAIANSQGDAASAGGNPATYQYDYLGPAINSGDPANPISSGDAIDQLFAWFNANGGTDRPTRGSPTIPGVNRAISDTLKSPNVREFTVGVTRRLGSRGAVRLDGVFRDFSDFYSERVDLSTAGGATDPLGRRFDLRIVENTNALERSYRGLNFQISYRVGETLSLGGNYTLGKAQGNFDGETGPNGPVRALVNFYAEYFDPAWGGGGAAGGGGPVGDLLNDVRHKMRLWASWDAPIPKSLGRLNLGGLQFFSTGSPYGSLGLVDTRPYVTNPGYLTPPATVEYHFENRDTYRMADTWRTDLALNWSRSLGIRKAEIFLRGTVLNVFDRQEVTNFFGGNEPGAAGGCGTGGCIDTTIRTNNNTSALARFNPFTETPIEGVHWSKGDSFGDAKSRYAYQTPRTLSFSLGVRF